VFLADVLVADVERLPETLLECLLGFGAERDMTAPALPNAPGQDAFPVELLDPLNDLLDVDAELTERLRVRVAHATSPPDPVEFFGKVDRRQVEPDEQRSGRARR
jgi:hypothetical protein